MLTEAPRCLKIPGGAETTLAAPGDSWKSHNLCGRKENPGAPRHIRSLGWPPVSLYRVINYMMSHKPAYDWHLPAAFAGLGSDNALVELDRLVNPILDGRASPFVEAFVEVGLLRQESLRDFVEGLKPIVVDDGEKRLAVLPSNELRITYAIDF